MRTTKLFNQLIEDLINQKTITNNQANYIFKVLNGSDIDLKELIKGVFNHPDFEGINLSNEQVLKGFDWLKNLMVTPNGKERKNNPFGYREQNALMEFETIRLIGYYDAGNYYRSFYVPLYDVYSKTGYGFQYYVNGGEIHIIG